MELKEALLEAVLDCAEGVYVVAEDSRTVVYANRCLTDSRGCRLVGEPCYRVLMGRETPCPFCPSLQEGDEPYAWDWFDARSDKWLKIKNRLVTVDGVRYRVGNLNEVHDMMELSREAVTGMGALNRVIQQYNQTRNELEFASTHDRMTRLYNRNQYIRDLSLAEDIRTAGVLFFDLNNLKRVNDLYRHAAGDMLLRRLAACLGPAEGKGRRAYRIGGDEFVVLVQNCTQEELDACLSGILAELGRRNEGVKIPCDVAAGAAWSDEVVDLEELVGLADQRMYEDKERKKRGKDA